MRHCGINGSRTDGFRLLAVDSGHPDCALAATKSGELRHVGSGSIAELPGWWWNDEFDHAVVEIPTIRGAATPNAEDLLLIAVAGARLAQRSVSSIADVTEYRPSQWKGNTPKPPHHLRTLWPALAESERKLLGGAKTLKAIEAACKRGAADCWRKSGARYYRASEMPTVNGTKITHDILDASALALYALGRIRKG